MSLATLAVLAALAACAPAPAGGPRATTAPIASSSAFDPARFSGPWQVVAAFGSDAACGRLDEAWSVRDGRLAVSGMACRDGAAVPVDETVRLVGPGQMLRPDGPGGGEAAFWVLWVDADYRVAATGSPDGRFGRIMARPGMARDDLITAARKILAFYGYDISGLQTLP